jgi:hypothetical protein
MQGGEEAMANDVRAGAEDGSTEIQGRKRPFGRSLSDFKDQDTESGLLPAEDKLLAAVERGDECDLTSYQKRHELTEQLHTDLEGGEILKLAAELLAHPSKVFDRNYREKEHDRKSRENLEARINARPRIVIDFLKELPEFIRRHDEAPTDLKTRVSAQPDLLEPFLNALGERFKSEIAQWRQVDKEDGELRVRAGFVRFLALGGDDLAPVHEKGVQLEAAYIEDEFNLAGCANVRPLDMRSCLFSDIDISQARLRRVNLSGCRVQGIEGVRCKTDGSVFLDRGFSIIGSVRLVGAEIGGTFDCSSSTFNAGLNCSNSKIGGDVHLSSEFYTYDEVSFEAAHIAGDLNCAGGTFRNRLNVQNARIGGNMYLSDGCDVRGQVSARGIQIGADIDCSSGNFANADGRVLAVIDAKIGGNAILSEGFAANGEVSFVGTHIFGDLICSGGKFSNADGFALNLASGRITGSALLNFGFKAKGCVIFHDAEIGNTLECNNSEFDNRTSDGEGTALNLQRLRCGKSVFLCRGFTAHGQVGLVGAHIGGNLICYSATFDNLVPGASRETFSRARWAAMALTLENATIADALWLAPIDSPSESATIKGSVHLEGARARLLVDDVGCWPARSAVASNGESLRCSVNLNSFTYDRLADVAPTDASQRIKWLKLQPPAHIGADFRPQPYEQLIKVLREMGHEDDAKRVALEKQRMRRRAKGAVAWRNFKERLTHWWGWIILPFSLIALALTKIGLFIQLLILDLLLGGGYAKIRPMILFAALFIGCTLFYGLAAREGLFVPSNPALFNNPEVRAACAGTASAPDISTPIDWYRCKSRPAELNPFRPLVYSLDLMIPFVQLGQRRDWQPIAKVIELDSWGVGAITLPPSTTQIVTWSQSIGSMLLYLLIAAILGGLIKRD